MTSWVVSDSEVFLATVLDVLAEHFNQPAAYDSQYLAVAEPLNCDSWTKDRHLFNAVSSQLTWVKWIGDFERPQ